MARIPFAPAACMVASIFAPELHRWYLQCSHAPCSRLIAVEYKQSGVQCCRCMATPQVQKECTCICMWHLEGNYDMSLPQAIAFIKGTCVHHTALSARTDEEAPSLQSLEQPRTGLKPLRPTVTLEHTWSITAVGWVYRVVQTTLYLLIYLYCKHWIWIRFYWITPEDRGRSRFIIRSKKFTIRHYNPSNNWEFLVLQWTARDNVWSLGMLACVQTKV